MKPPLTERGSRAYRAASSRDTTRSLSQPPRSPVQPPRSVHNSGNGQPGSADLGTSAPVISELLKLQPHNGRAEWTRKHGQESLPAFQKK
jgi:hypothetical protein